MKIHFRAALPLVLLAAVAMVQAQVLVSIRIAPPVLPVVAVAEMPICPAPGYLWTPGYWAYGDAGYFWVPGVWVLPPAVGLLWTPGYWGFVNGIYVWHEGYWGPHVGFYGGVNYGFGYVGVGFLGGVWAGNVFRYNTAVLRVGPGFRDVYVNRAAIVAGGPRYSFNGPGGWTSRPTAAEMAAQREHHFERTAAQRDYFRSASLDRANRFSENHGRVGAMRAAERGGPARPGVAARPAAPRAGAPRPTERFPGARPGEARPSGAAPRGTPAPRNESARPERSGGAGRGAPAPRGGGGHAAPPSHGREQKGEERH